MTKKEYFVDLHNHSKYARATSKKMNLEEEAHWVKKKGVNVLGTGDFTHPSWFKELKQKLLKEEDNGVYEYKGVKWVLTTEVANVYSTPQKIRKIHHVIISPSFETTQQINEQLSKKGNLSADGRPILGKYESHELVEDMKKIDEKIEVIPAHVWTPWFGLFGDKSGYDHPKECYQDQLKNVHALETGLSSDPEMNWACSFTDNFTLISNSDSHSPYPWRLGRECNVMMMKQFTYDEMIKQIRNNEIAYTIEVDPNYGKYHYNGHRNCGVRKSPEQTRDNKCPVCHKPLTIGVLQRVYELADRPIGYKPPNAKPFKKILPLHEILKHYFKTRSLNTKTMNNYYNELIQKFGTELRILLHVEKQELIKHLPERVVEMIMLNRENKIKFTPGYDGVYGTPKFEFNENNQTTLKQF